MDELRVLHVVSISFSLPYFVGNQFLYFKDKGVKYFVAATDSPHLHQYAAQQEFVTLPLSISRSISPLKDIKAILALRRLIKKHKINMVIGHTPKGGMIAMMAAYMAGVRKRIYFRHGIMYETSTGTKRKLLKYIEALTGRLATQVVCVSDSILAISNGERLSSPAKNIILAHGTCNGVDTTHTFNPKRYTAAHVAAIRHQWHIEATDFVFGFVGRLVRDKGIPELIAAWKMLRTSHKHIKLLLVGPFEERDALSPELQQYIVAEPSIIATGLVAETADFYAAMDAFVLPSHREGFPTGILEASAMQLPIITTKATGCRDAILDSKTGIFCTHEPADIMHAMQRMLEHRDWAAKLGMQGRAWIKENFDEKTVWQAIEDNILTK